MMLMQKKEPTEKVSQILNDTFELETYVPFIVYDRMTQCILGFFLLFFGTILFFTSTLISIYISWGSCYIVDYWLSTLSMDLEPSF